MSLILSIGIWIEGRESTLCMSGGRGFQIWRAARRKAWLPIVLRPARGIVKRMEEGDLRERGYGENVTDLEGQGYGWP